MDIGYVTIVLLSWLGSCASVACKNQGNKPSTISAGNLKLTQTWQSFFSFFFSKHPYGLKIDAKSWLTIGCRAVIITLLFVNLFNNNIFVSGLDSTRRMILNNISWIWTIGNYINFYNSIVSYAIHLFVVKLLFN